MPVRPVPACVLGLAIAVAAGCGRSPTDLGQLYDEAERLLRRGLLADVISMAEKGAAAADVAPDPVRAWDFRLLAAEAYASRLDMPAVRRILDAAVPDGEPFSRARVRQHLLRARVTIAQGDLKRAEGLIDEALARASTFPDLQVDLQLLRAQVLYRTGRASAADTLLDHLRSSATTGSDPYRQALVLNTSGMGLVTRSRFDEALADFEQVLALKAVEGTTVYAGALNNAGICLARLGQFERAVPLQEQAVAFQKQGRRQEYIQALGELGSTYFLQGSVERGMAAWQEALRMAADGQLRDEAVLWARNLAMAAVQQGDWDAAERYNAEAERRAGEMSGSRKAYALLTAAQIAGGRGHREQARRIYREALAAAAEVPAVQWTAHDGLARLAVAEGKRAEATQAFERALATVEQTRSALLRTDSRISFPSRLISFYRGYVDFLMSQGDVARALEVADSSRARVLAERQGVSAPAVRARAGALRDLARRAHATLVFYWLGPERSWAWTVSARGVAARPLPRAAEIEAMVADHERAVHDALADPLAAPGSTGERLFDAVVRPLGVPPGASVVIVPDGALHRVNFETLVPAAPSRHYWIEDVTVQIAPSLAMLQTASSGVSPTSLLLVGNPVPRPPEFPVLSYAAAEMSGVTKHFEAASVLTLAGGQASPAAFVRAQPERYSVIHFTSHAVANVESPLDSAVILSGPDQAYKLYARDVANAKLRAELVTVSACRSAGERAYSGEGLVGFAWAFLRGGARRVVAGLWDVDDRSTAALMERMYARMAAGAAPAAALREAKLMLMREGYPKPYHWAPFQMFTLVL